MLDKLTPAPLCTLLLGVCALAATAVMMTGVSLTFA
jgi:hypothetical protein